MGDIVLVDKQILEEIYGTFSSHSVSIFKKLSKKNQTIHCFKNIFLMFFLISILFINMDIFNFIPYNFENILRWSWFLLISCFFYYSFVFLTKWILYRKLNSNEQLNNINPFKDIKKSEIVLFLMSPDYFFSKYYKKKLASRYENSESKLFFTDANFNRMPLEKWGELKVEKKFFIEWSNWSNVIISIYFVTLLFFYANSPNVTLFIYVLLSIVILINIYSTGNIYSTYILIFGTFLFVFVCFVQNSVGLYILFYFIVFRFISRSIEIIFSFYKDVAEKSQKIIYKELNEGFDRNLNEDLIVKVEDKPKFIKVMFIDNIKTSLLMGTDRLSLAIHTLIEIVILCSGIYFILEINENTFVKVDEITILETENFQKDIIKNGSERIIEFKVDNETNITPLNSFLFSSSLGVFNYSFDPSKNTFWKVIHVLQILVSVVLILLSIAQYLGHDKKLTKYEEEFYLKTHQDR